MAQIKFLVLGVSAFSWMVACGPGPAADDSGGGAGGSSTGGKQSGGAAAAGGASGGAKSGGATSIGGSTSSGGAGAQAGASPWGGAGGEMGFGGVPDLGVPQDAQLNELTTLQLLDLCRADVEYRASFVDQPETYCLNEGHLAIEEGSSASAMRADCQSAYDGCLATAAEQFAQEKADLLDACDGEPALIFGGAGLFSTAECSGTVAQYERCLHDWVTVAVGYNLACSDYTPSAYRSGLPMVESCVELESSCSH